MNTINIARKELLDIICQSLSILYPEWIVLLPAGGEGSRVEQVNPLVSKQVYPYNGRTVMFENIEDLLDLVSAARIICRPSFYPVLKAAALHRRIPEHRCFVGVEPETGGTLYAIKQMLEESFDFGREWAFILYADAKICDPRKLFRKVADYVREGVPESVWHIAVSAPDLGIDEDGSIDAAKGWIVSGEELSTHQDYRIYAVEDFVEKPNGEAVGRVSDLVRAGNAFVNTAIQAVRIEPALQFLSQLTGVEEDASWDAIVVPQIPRTNKVLLTTSFRWDDIGTNKDLIKSQGVHVDNNWVTTGVTVVNCRETYAGCFSSIWKLEIEGLEDLTIVVGGMTPESRTLLTIMPNHLNVTSIRKVRHELGTHEPHCRYGETPATGDLLDMSVFVPDLEVCLSLETQTIFVRKL